ncbi:MAG: SURF1 family cytochrome oxidase biogenesis protein [Sphingopyxis sp.]
MTEPENDQPAVVTPPAPNPTTAPTPAPRRWPVVATVLVACAVAVMIGLGVWQLGRAKEKDALIATWQANLALPAAAYPASNPTDAAYMYRTLSANCLRVVHWRSQYGRTQAGVSGWRHIAACATGAEGPGVLVDMGVSEGPEQGMGWTGGPVRGIATTEPDSHSALARLFGRLTGQPLPPLQLMIVAETPAPGLAASARPDPSAVPSSHLAYAGQWFLFAAAAAIIFIMAVRQRWRKAGA